MNGVTLLSDTGCIKLACLLAPWWVYIQHTNVPAVANNPSFSQPAPAAYASPSSTAAEYAGSASTTVTYATYAGAGGGESSTDGGEGNLY